MDNSEEKKLLGRPAMYESVEKLEKEIDLYFDALIISKDPPTITGLCLFLGFESRQSFYDYQEKQNFTYAIKKARLKIECEYEKSLHKQSPTGAIFALKNMGWSDRTEIDHTSAGKGIGFSLNIKQDKEE